MLSPPSIASDPVFCPFPSSGSMNQFTAIYNGNGELINNIKYYDGFMGQRVGAISCLAFHPHWVCIPAGTWGWHVPVSLWEEGMAQRPPQWEGELPQRGALSRLPAQLQTSTAVVLLVCGAPAAAQGSDT